MSRFVVLGESKGSSALSSSIMGVNTARRAPLYANAIRTANKCVACLDERGRVQQN